MDVQQAPRFRRWAAFPVARSYLGGIACSGISIGGGSLGLITIGGVGLGLICLGGLALGGYAVGGFAIGMIAVGGGAIALYDAEGGLAIGGHAARGGLAIATDYAVGGEARAAHANDPAAQEYMATSPVRVGRIILGPWFRWMFGSILALTILLVVLGRNIAAKPPPFDGDWSG